MLWLLLSSACSDIAADTAVPDPAPVACTTLTYENFGEAYVRNWCMNCHSGSSTGGDRYGAPETVNFDTLDEVREWADRISARTAPEYPTMPPAGGADLGERERFAAWLDCGAP